MYSVLRATFLIVSLLLVSFSSKALADEPVKVMVGSYVQNVTDLDLRGGKATVDFYLWFRWTSATDISPHETFELVNGTESSKSVQEFRQNGDEKYAVLRVKAVLDVLWDLKRFSIDRQVIPIQVEDGVNETDAVVYVPDTGNLAIRSDIRLPGYVVAGGRADMSTSTYKTNFGDTKLPPDSASSYSRYQYSVVIERSGFGYFVKLFATMVLSTLIVAVAFAMEPENIDGRTAIGIGSLFAVVATNYVISAQLPEADVFSLADQINFFSMGVIVVSLALAVMSWRIHNNGGSEAVIRNLDRIGLIGIPVLYLSVIAAIALL